MLEIVSAQSEFVRRRCRLCWAALLLSAALPAQDFYAECWVRTTKSGADFPTLFANKDWGSGEIKDYTTHHAYGRSRTSGTQRGYAFALQPSGSWTFNVGDGRSRLDYRPTVERQPVNDGALHMLAASLDAKRKELWLYYDGRNVAIYSVAGMGDMGLGQVLEGSSGSKAQAVEQCSQSPKAKTAATIAESFRKATGGKRPVGSGLAADRQDSIRVLAWNIWHGGRRDGDAVGIDKTVEAIRDSRADVVCMQETYGSGAAIADALGFYFYLRSTNLSVMSRYPIRATYDLYQPFRFGGVAVELSKGQQIKFFSLWINHLPDIGKQMAADGTTADSLIVADAKTRGRELRGILQALAPHTETANQVPVIVAGDFNSPSHLDWTAKTAKRHKGLSVAWPVSSQMVAAGYTDAFRAVHADPSEVVGRTWSPRFTKSYSMRIDYVYVKGDALRARAARMIDKHVEGWPSDHAAVLAELAIVDHERAQTGRKVRRK